jgi:hypothetical protein
MNISNFDKDNFDYLFMFHEEYRSKIFLELENKSDIKDLFMILFKLWKDDGESSEARSSKYLTTLMFKIHFGESKIITIKLSDDNNGITPIGIFKLIVKIMEYQAKHDQVNI